MRVIGLPLFVARADAEVMRRQLDFHFHSVVQREPYRVSAVVKGRCRTRSRRTVCVRRYSRRVLYRRFGSLRFFDHLAARYLEPWRLAMGEFDFEGI